MKNNSCEYGADFENMAVERGNLLHAAVKVANNEGVEGLTLRPLAVALDTNAASLMRKFGQKAEILKIIIAEAIDYEKRNLDKWLRIVGKVRVLTKTQLYDIVNEIIRSRCTGQNAFGEAISGRDISLLKCGFIQNANFNNAYNLQLKTWFDNDVSFFNALWAKTENASKYDFGLFMKYFMTDEIAHALTMEQFEEYLIIRSHSLKAIINGLFEHKTDDEIFDNCIEELGHNNLNEFMKPMSERDIKIGKFIVDVIVEKGLGGLTHREVSKKANIPFSSIAYYYPKQKDLALLGIKYLVAIIKRNVKQISPDMRFSRDIDIVPFGNYSLAVTAGTMEELTAIVIEMRRRRGENLIKILKANCDKKLYIDLPAVQAVSCALFGLSTLINCGLGYDNEAVDLFTDIFKRDISFLFGRK